MPTLYVKVRFSWVLCSILIGLHLLALSAIWLSALTLSWQCLMLILLLISASYCYKHYLTNQTDTIIACEYRQAEWCLQLANQTSLPVILKSAYISNIIFLLRFYHSKQKKHYHLILFYDALLTQERKNLRRCLRN